jgi:zinc/manganese transport system substrate-binding protein
MRRSGAIVAVVVALSACGGSSLTGETVVPFASPDTTVPAVVDRAVIVATNSVLQAFVQMVVGDTAEVLTVIPDGKDPHDFEPSAQDIAALNSADLIVQNGLDFEHGVEDSIDTAEKAGVRVWTLTDHVTLIGEDPHVFTDPLTMAGAVDALATAVTGLEGVAADPASAQSQLEAAASAAGTSIKSLGAGKCRLVTDHDALAYFAKRFGCTIVGAVIPSFSSSAEASARDLEAVRQAAGSVKAIFMEEGAPDAVVRQVADELGIRLVELRIHALPADGSYAGYVTALVESITEALS